MGMRIGHAPMALTNFLEVAKACNFKVSDRTSIHVHLNALNMTLDQLNGLLIVYVICEQALFNYSSAHRKHNIFCVPLESHLLSVEYENLKHLLERVTKYSSLNLKSVWTHGTVEFRHMETVYEFAPIWNWIMLLGLMHRYAMVTPLREIKSIVSRLKIQSEYDLFLRKIFFNYAPLLQYDPIDVDRAVSDSKLLFFKES
jgi:hypothetical protein